MSNITQLQSYGRQTYKDMISSELASHGIKAEFGRGRKHPYAEWKMPNGDVKRYTYPGSPSDYRGILNCRTDLRRVLNKSEIAKPNEIQPDDTSSANSLITISNGIPSVSSRSVAGHFQKQHKDVLKAIRELIAKDDEWGKRHFTPFKTKDLTGESTSHYDMSRDGFSVLAMGFTGDKAFKWKIKFLAAFNEMECQLSILPETRLQDQINQLRGELNAATDLIFELSERQILIPASTVTNKAKRPWVSKRFPVRNRFARSAPEWPALLGM